MQILPGLYLVNGFPYGMHQNSYVVRTGGTAILIDSGELESGNAFAALQEGCRRWEIELSDISHFLVTHAHFDHCSHAAKLKQLGIRVVASRAVADAMASGDERCIGFAVHRTFETCDVDVIVEDEQRLELGEVVFRCIAAPGHADGHMIYELDLDGKRIWFCGDVIAVGSECRSVELGIPAGRDFDREAYLETLGKLVKMELHTLCPGHGPPGIGIGKRLVEAAYFFALQKLQ